MCKEALDSTIIGFLFDISIECVRQFGKIDAGQFNQRHNERGDESHARFMPWKISLHNFLKFDSFRGHRPVLC